MSVKLVSVNKNANFPGDEGVNVDDVSVDEISAASTMMKEEFVADPDGDLDNGCFTGIGSGKENAKDSPWSLTLDADGVLVGFLRGRKARNDIDYYAHCVVSALRCHCVRCKTHKIDGKDGIGRWNRKPRTMGAPTPDAGFMEFLNDDFLLSGVDGVCPGGMGGLLNAMDPDTLAAVCAMGGDQSMSLGVAHGMRKREAPDEGDEDSGEDGDAGPSAKKCKGEAARNKANREKARREKLNDR